MQEVTLDRAIQIGAPICPTPTSIRGRGGGQGGAVWARPACLGKTVSLSWYSAKLEESG